MIPYGRQSIDEDDIAAVTAALEGDFLTTGPKVADFEQALAEATGAKEAVACSNGTTALHLACMIAGLGEGDAAIVPSLTFLATANAVRYCGAEVIFADVDPETGLMRPEDMEEALKRAGDMRVKAVLPVHLAGQGVDLPALREISDQHGLRIIADSCHALGGEINGGKAGACRYEDMATFSFHPVKTIATGEGGAVTTNNSEWAARMRTWRSHGMVRKPDIGPWAYEMAELGYNYRITDIQCALGLSQLKKLDRFVARRKKLVAHYIERLAPLAPVIRPPEIANAENNPGWHLFSARIDFAKLGMNRAALMSFLIEHGIGTQVHYIPVHTQPYYKNRYGALALPGADAYYERTLSLPLYPDLSEADIDYICKTLTTALKREAA